LVPTTVDKVPTFEILRSFGKGLTVTVLLFIPLTVQSGLIGATTEVTFILLMNVVGSI